MRKSCRWLGCAALMCFATLDLSGSCSSALEAGFKLPWRKDRSSTTKKETKSTAEESSDLLAKARAYERAGDFPNATRAYRQYLEQGGEPQAIKKADDNNKAVTQTDTATAPTKSREKSTEDGLFSGLRAKPEARLTSKSKENSFKKSKDPNFERNLGLPESGNVEDPWATQPGDESPSVANSTVKDESTAARAEATPSQNRSMSGTAAKGKQTAGTEAKIASNSKSQLPEGVTKESLDNLLDLDSGDLNWGDEPKPSDGDLPADAGSPVDVAATDAASSDAELPDAPWAQPAKPAETPAPQQTADASLPLIDFNTKETVEPSKQEVVAETPSSVNSADDWTNTPIDTPAKAPRIVAAKSQPAESETEAFAPPIIESEEELSPPNKPQPQRTASWAVDEGVSTAADLDESAQRPLASRCLNCEPWVYAQVVKLDSSDPEVRKEGLDRLADMGRKAHPAASAIRVILKDSDPFVRAHAAWTWWQVENEAFGSVETLKTLLKDSDANVVELACYILGDIGAPADSTVEALALLRDHSDGATKVQAAEALIRISGTDEKSLKVLTTAMKSKDGQVRWSAAVALGRCRGSQSPDAIVTALTGALKDVDPEVRSAAALSLGGLGKDAEKAKPELQRIASSDTAQVREAALAALACLKL